MNRSIGLIVAAALAVPACGQTRLEAPYSGQSRHLLRPVVGAPPTLVPPGRPVTLEALVGPGVTDAELVWSRKGDKAAPRARAMRREAPRKFAFEVPAAELAPGRYEYVVRASAPGGPVDSVTYSLTVAALDTVEPLLTPMRRRAFTTTTWGSGIGQLGREGGEEAATIVPAAIAAIGDDQIAVADTANSRVVVLGRDGRYVREVALVDARVEELAYHPATDTLFALDAFHETVWMIRGPEATPVSVTLPGVDADSVVDVVLGPDLLDAFAADDAAEDVLYAIVEPQLHALPILQVDGQPVGSDWSTLLPGIPTDFGGYTVSIDPVTDDVAVQVFDPLFTVEDTELLPAARIPFVDDVLDVTPVSAEPSGVVSLLVATLGPDGVVRDLLVHVDTASATATMAEVTEFEPGDTTRRIATTSSGVVIFTEQGNAPFFAEYTSEEGA